MARAKKPKVTVSAGVTVYVEEEDGRQRPLTTCTGSSAVTGHSPQQVLKYIQDCVENATKAATSSSKRRK